ncbi:uncharacterized protein IL334_002475 [Kwoniella shivajii]|uniref:tRNA-splicing endonuclease subunit Sen34 n=1 Tax=Kwoniella shivajii TaxID=564305 RepID=A0ABZ1CUU4_9TREE|nr:hypothetical protein IL334_002475 [Kwoniella shivajii]
MADIPKNGESSTSSTLSSIKEGSIPLYLVNGVATVWDAQVAATLHCIHNVSGIRAGTLPGVSQQNGFLGLPVTLMREETAYLVQQGIAHLVPLPSFPTIPSTDEIAQHTQNRIKKIQRLESLARAAEEEKKALSAEAFEKGGEKARLKREARAKAKAEKAASTQNGQDGVFEESSTMTTPTKKESSVNNTISTEVSSEVNSSKSEIPSKESMETTTSPSSTPGYFLSIPSHPPILTFTPTGETITSIPHPLFPFPSTPRENALVGLFSTLQSMGYRMGLGPRFGGEYLIYPGDYLRYHAHFTSQVLVRDQPIRPAEIVAWGRLGTGTKKAGLLCCWDDQKRSSSNDQVSEDEGGTEFYSLEWANFG